MKRTAIQLFIIILLTSPVVFGATLHDTVVKSLKGLGNTHAIRIENVNGNCRLEVKDQPSVTVKAEITVKGPSDEACDEFYRKLSIDLTTDEKGVLAQVDYPRSHSWFSFGKSPQAVVDLTISIPTGWDVSIDLVNGDVQVASAKACMVNLVNGDVHIDRADKLTVDLVNGSVRAGEVRRTVACDVINGSLAVTMTGSHVEKTDVDIVNGDIELTLPWNIVGRVDLESATGKVVVQEKSADGNWRTKLKSKRISMKEEGPACLKLETVNGRITLKLAKQ